MLGFGVFKVNGYEFVLGLILCVCGVVSVVVVLVGCYNLMFGVFFVNIVSGLEVYFDVVWCYMVVIWVGIFNILFGLFVGMFLYLMGILFVEVLVVLVGLVLLVVIGGSL